MPVNGVETKEEYTRAGHVVLSGDSTGDARFRELLRGVLGHSYDELIQFGR